VRGAGNKKTEQTGSSHLRIAEHCGKEIRLNPWSANKLKRPSVPRPTETLVFSNKHTPGYRMAAIMLRIFGEGSTQS
jgi:hypothetical protein